MWSHQQAIMTDAPKEQLWKLLADMEHWNRWDEDVQWCKLNGEFKTGIAYFLKRTGAPKLFGVIRNHEPLKRFTAVSYFMSLATIESTYQLIDVEDGVKLSHQVSISGHLAWLFVQLVGKRMCKGFPTAAGNLVRLAKQQPIKTWAIGETALRD